MRKLIAYMAAFLLAVSCMSELEQVGRGTGSSLEGAPVTITFSVPDIPVLTASKSLEDGDGNITDTPYLDPDKMYLVVCGGSQSIKYIRKAKLVDSVPDYTVPEEAYPNSEGNRTVTLYKFRVQLELSDFGRTIHILGNVDENQLITGSFAYNSLPGLLSFDNKQAYWQRIYVPHIKAKLDADNNEIQLPDGSYEPDDETIGFFQHIPLIRNYAKIQVTNIAENFELHSYAVIFYPERGSVVPYRSNEPVKENRFDFNPPEGYRFSGYEKSAFRELETDINYLGNMPSGVALSDDIPSAAEFEDPSKSGGRVLLYKDNDDSGFYIYERGIPTDRIGPTFVIICGKFDKDDNWYYYRLDLMESKEEDNQTVSKYYPIYRNFRYNIQLHRVSSEGVLTPEAAANSSGVEDISADVSMRHLSDISNGTTRLIVEPFMTRTYSGPSEEGFYELYVRFFNNVSSDQPNMNTTAVRVELEPMTDGSDDILILYDGNGKRVPTKGFFFPAAADEVGGVPGIRTIRFNTIEPPEETKTQKIKITGHNPGSDQALRLYREVEITLQKKQPLTVKCTETVPTTAGSSVTVDISIPSELPESMFPVSFIVEPEAGTLTPDTSQNVNLPVVSGRSIATLESAFTGKPVFHYLRTLTWDEFSHLPIEENQRTFQCFFKTNRDFNATTVWVYNEYFDKGHDSFKNMLPLTLACNPVLAEADKPINLAVTIHSQIPESYFPLDFIVEPEDLTMTPLGSDMTVVTGPSIATSTTTFLDTDATQFIRSLTWEEYENLPAVGNERTLYCYFQSTVALSATTFWVYNENFYKAKIAFENEDVIPDNHFWVEAVNGTCSVKLNYSDLQYKKDDGAWTKYSQNASITLNEGQKVSFKGGSKSKKLTRKVNNAFKCTGGQFKVGGNLASLMVGDDYATEGAGKTGDTFIDFFKSHTGLVDAYDLELPMKSLTTNAFKSMFDSCTNLERGPQILPATTLNTTCYRNMFYNCTSLVYAPALPATTLKDEAYQRMFWHCEKLDHIRMLGSNWIENVFKKSSESEWWCDGVAPTGVIEFNIALESIYGTANWNNQWGKIVPAGWTVEFVTP